MKKLVCLLIACLVCTACAAPTAGGGEGDVTSQTVPTEHLIDADITKVLSAQQVGDVLQVRVAASDALEYGTQLRFSSDDGRVTVDLTMAEGTLADLQALGSTEGFSAAPNLPREAFWHAAGRELLLWYDGYWLSIAVSMPDASGDQLLVCARALARTAIENIA